MKQGCFIAPTLFTIYLFAILFLVHDLLPCGAEVDYRLDGRLFNLSRLKAKTKVTKAAVIDLQYAYECTILAHTAEELQTSLDLLTEAYQGIGLSINMMSWTAMTLCVVADLWCLDSGGTTCWLKRWLIGGD